MDIKKLNERHAKFWDSQGGTRKLVAELPGNRFHTETDGNVVRIYDTQPTEGESNPLDACTGPLGEQLARDRRTVADATASQADRLRALGRLWSRR